MQDIKKQRAPHTYATPYELLSIFKEHRFAVSIPPVGGKPPYVLKDHPLLRCLSNGFDALFHRDTSFLLEAANFTIKKNL